MKISTNFLTIIVFVSLLMLQAGACNQTNPQKIDDTIVTDTVYQKKEWRQYTLTGILPYDSVHYFLVGTDTIQRIQWKNGSKDGICLMGWKITKSRFIYPDHSDTIYGIDTVFNYQKYEYWREKQLLKIIEVHYFDNHTIESVDTLYITGKDTLGKFFSWEESGKLNSKFTTLNRNFIDSLIILNSNGKPLALDFYNKKSQLIRGLSYDDDGNLTDERYEDLKTGEIIYRIKDGKKVK